MWCVCECVGVSMCVCVSVCVSVCGVCVCTCNGEQKSVQFMDVCTMYVRNVSIMLHDFTLTYRPTNRSNSSIG